MLLSSEVIRASPPQPHSAFSMCNFRVQHMKTRTKKNTFRRSGDDEEEKDKEQ